MFEEDKGVYNIGTVAEIIEEHPETLRVWERNSLVEPYRINGQRKYSNNDLKRLKFIKYLIHGKGLNIAGVAQVIKMYPCWNKIDCVGGAAKNSIDQVNDSKLCWKIEGTYCLTIRDKAELCSACKAYNKCRNCNNSFCSKS